MNKTEQKLNFVYIGPALDSGEIDATDLGASLVAIGSLFHRANSILNDEKASLEVKVQALKHGSFDIGLNISQTVINKTIGLLTGNELTALLNLCTLLGLAGGTGIGVFQFIKNLKGRKILKSEPSENTIIITLEDGQSMTISTPVMKLYQDAEIRTAIEKTVKPLEREGIEALEVRSNSTVNVEVLKSDVPFFEYSPEKEELGESEQTLFVTLETVNFKQGKWKINDGTKSFYAAMKDEAFSRAMFNGETTFAANDILKVNLKLTQSISAVGLKTTYEIIKVIEHKKSPQQSSFKI